MHSEVKTFGGWPGMQKGCREATSLQEKHQGRTDILPKVQGLLRTKGEKDERYHQFCVLPTIKHPDTIHVWGLARLAHNCVYEHVNKLRKPTKPFQKQLLLTIQEQFGDKQFLFKHDGARCRKAELQRS